MSSITLFFDCLFLATPAIFAFMGVFFWLAEGKTSQSSWLCWIFAVLLLLLVLQGVYECGFFPTEGF